MFEGQVFADRGKQRRGGAHVFIVNALPTSKKKKNEESWGAVYVLQTFLHIYDIGIILQSQSTHIMYIQKHLPQ